MRTLAAMGCMGMLVVSIAVACSGDEAKKVRGDDAGAAGLGAAGVDASGGVHQGGGRADPIGGSEGVPVLGGAGAGGATGAGAAAGLGGAGGVLEMNGGAGAAGGLGGAPASDCPAQTGNFTHQCADAVTTWAPAWNGSQARFELQLGALPFPLASGTISYFYNNADTQQCGTVPIQVNANGITAPVSVQFSPIAVRITTFTFTDVCGNTHTYDAAGAPACNDIRGSGTGFNTFALACNTRLDANCPEACN